MGRGCANCVGMLGLLAGLLAGCAAPPAVPTTSWLLPFQGPTGDNVVQMDVAVLERPAGDAYVNRELWDLADEQALPYERKAALQDNGFRVGQVGGMPPPGLLDLLRSEQSCVSSRRVRLRAGTPKEVPLGPDLPVCRYHVPGGQPGDEFVAEQARCLLVIVPTVTKDGRTCLRFTPQVRHGETRHVAAAAPDQSGFVLLPQQPTETYPGLSFEVTLAANEYLVVGGRLDLPETLGHQCFVRPDGPSPLQRLLVIRTGGKASGAAEGLAEAGEATPRGPTVASHASWTAVRGSSR